VPASELTKTKKYIAKFRVILVALLLPQPVKNTVVIITALGEEKQFGR
jgi:hypothetical protein